ncbi:MAG: tetratricopeptide repeat protein [Microcoleaceae cyanobacterium]
MQVYPNNPRFYQSLGSVAEKKGDSSQAIENYYRAIKIDPQRPIWLYLSLGNLLTDMERFDECATLYQSAIEVYPDDSRLYQALGVVAAKGGNVEAAIENYYHAISANPQQPIWIYSTLGLLLREQNLFDQSIAIHQASVELYPDHPEPYRLLGATQEKAGDTAGAIASYQQLITIQPEQNLWAYLSLGQLLEHQDCFDESIAVYKTAIQTFPDNTAEIYRLMGTAQNRANNFEDAVYSYRQAIELEPKEHPWVYTTLGQLLEEQDEIDEAIALYEAAAKYHPKHDGLQRMLGLAQKKRKCRS